MKNQTQKFLKYSSLLAFTPFLFLAIEGFTYKGISLDMAEINQQDSRLELHDGFDEAEDNLFQSNPMVLLDAWRRSTAMDDATQPSDALDEAIKAFEGKELVNSSDD